MVSIGTVLKELNLSSTKGVEVKMLVYVLKQNGQPFMPTERFGKVRRLLKEGKAKVVRREPFTIKLLYEPKTAVVQNVTVV